MAKKIYKKIFSFQIGIFRIGIEVKYDLAQHKIAVWVSMQGKSMRNLRRKLRRLKDGSN